jgi:hypothetical protein
MQQVEMKIGEIPAVLYGSRSDSAYLYVHGQNGYKEEAKRFAEIVSEYGWQVLAIDLPEHGTRKHEADRFLPWIVVSELQQVWAEMTARWERVALRADSIGAWFSLLAFNGNKLERSLLVSPILDMERLIGNMMGWAGVTEAMLEARKTIPTDFGQTLSWTYWQFVKRHPIAEWSSETKVLYGSRDHLTERHVVDGFIKRFHCDLTVLEQGEHWFHTDEQLAFLDDWVKSFA